MNKEKILEELGKCLRRNNVGIERRQQICSDFQNILTYLPESEGLVEWLTKNGEGKIPKVASLTILCIGILRLLM